MEPTRSSPKRVPTEIWILNASPVITLAKAGYLQLVDELAPTVLIPDAVIQEILAGPADDAGRKALESGWGRPASPMRTPPVILEWGLGAGESSVLALALETRGGSVVLDDDAARKCARGLKLPLLGTLGIILRAKRQGLIPAAAPVVMALRTAGLHLDDATIRDALKQATGEAWPG